MDVRIVLVLLVRDGNVECGLWFFLGSWLECGLWIVVFSGVLAGMWIVFFSGVTRNVNTDGLVIGRVIHMFFVWNGACVLSLRGDLHNKAFANRY